MKFPSAVFVALSLAYCVGARAEEPKVQHRIPLEIIGVSVTPHVRARTMRYLADAGKADGALVRIFVRNSRPASEGESGALHANEVLFDGRFPIRLLLEGEWAWHDTPDIWNKDDALLPAGAVSVWTYNAVGPKWASGRKTILVEDYFREAVEAFPVEIAEPPAHLDAVTFLGAPNSVQPDTVIFHIANASSSPLKIASARLYLPENGKKFRALMPQPLLTNLKTFPSDATIPPGEQGGATVRTGPLPLTYCALEVRLSDAQGKTFSVWGHVRVKKETFDICGGWVAGRTRDGSPATSHEAFLKTLARIHVNAAHNGFVPGVIGANGPEGLFARYPLKMFDGLQPTDAYDTDALLPYIHGVDALGEPQLPFGEGQQTPQEVWKTLVRYAPTRLPTTVTLSDETSWPLYAGLSDFPHYDGYRVTAPSADYWLKYDRWNGKRIEWGAPLETIGDMCRALRDMSRPAPTAYWSQGPSDGWDVTGGRLRVAPTPDEIRLQAYHALSTRITSLYWFNLSAGAFAKFRDTIEELGRIGREMRMLEDFYLEGAAYRYKRLRRAGKLDWDLNSIASPRGALLFALDLDYAPDPKKKVFVFGSPRPARFDFDLPAYLRNPADVFRVDADGIHAVKFAPTPTGVRIDDALSKVGIYVATPDSALRARIEARRQDLIAQENALNFDPARNDADFKALQALYGSSE